MIKLIDKQFFLSTDEEEKNYFYGEDYNYSHLKFKLTLPKGTYRIIDGELCMILPSSLIDKKSVDTKIEKGEK